MSRRKELPYAVLAELTEEVGDCLEWMGAYRDQATPLPLWNCTSVRLLVWSQIHGDVWPDHRLSVRCNNHKCVHPDHIYQRRRKDELKGLIRSTAFKAKIAATKRAAMAVEGMSMELAREIRLSNEPQKQLAERLGFQEHWVGMVRRNQRWADFVTPFAGLMP